MRLLYLEPEEWRRQAFVEAFSERAGQAVDVAVSQTVGTFALHLQTSFEAVVLPPRIEPSEQHEDASKLDELIPWFLARQKPVLGLYRYRDRQETESDTVHLGKQIDINFLDYPENEQGYAGWAREFCDKNKVRYVLPARPLSWWKSRRWLVVDAKETTRAAFSIDKPEVDSDLAIFFALKGAQLGNCLRGQDWLSWEFQSETERLELEPANDGHCVFFRDGPAGGELSDQALEVLRELKLVTFDA